MLWFDEKSISSIRIVLLCRDLGSENSIWRPTSYSSSSNFATTPAQADEMPTQKIGFSPICKIIRDDLSDIIIFFIRTISPSHLNQKPLPKWQDDLTSEYKYYTYLHSGINSAKFCNMEKRFSLEWNGSPDEKTGVEEEWRTKYVNTGFLVHCVHVSTTCSRRPTPSGVCYNSWWNSLTDWLNEFFDLVLPPPLLNSSRSDKII